MRQTDCVAPPSLIFEILHDNLGLRSGFPNDEFRGW
jgi:hypothetical protein